MLSGQITVQNKTRLASPKLEAFAGQVGRRWSRVGVLMASQLTSYFNIKNTVESFNYLGKVSIQSHLHKPKETLIKGTSENFACE